MKVRELTGLDIPSSFRETCACCDGVGDHLVCSPAGQKCETCSGTGWVMTSEGRDIMRLLRSWEE